MKNHNVINLNKARKTRRRERDRQKADENAVLFGLPKSERTNIRMDRMRTDSFLNGIRLPPKDDADTQE